ncbi:MAG: hypothetical protein Hyperionvirus4_9 [Hyperionvirus sp.]|uniref:Uncharacterized protein n=1 Tax=Hyperionvirus sp. TaxID=2487770 RepID=A0A3G5A981_9VIRU|nr:MAG: hypothetical protein Hyperionvirus4_9 [Hyperionvirus sp.]
MSDALAAKWKYLFYWDEKTKKLERDFNHSDWIKVLLNDSTGLRYYNTLLGKERPFVVPPSDKNWNAFKLRKEVQTIEDITESEAAKLEAKWAIQGLCWYNPIHNKIHNCDFARELKNDDEIKEGKLLRLILYNRKNKRDEQF